MTEMPPACDVERLPSEWEKVIGLHIKDPDGWREGSIFGAKDWSARITRAEFLQRAGVSTVEKKYG